MSTWEPTSNRGAWLRQAFEQYESGLLRYTRQITGDWESARDIAQEAFLKLCRHEPAETGDPPGPWLYRVCRNRAIDQHRSRQRHPQAALDDLPDPPAPDSDPGDLLAQSDRHRAVHKLLEELSPRQREIVRLKFLHELSYKEIAQITGLTPGNVGVHLHNALRRLREHLNQQDTPPAFKELLQP